MRKAKGLILIILMCAFAYIYYAFILVKCPTIAPALMGTFLVVMAYIAYLMYGFVEFENTPIQVMLIRNSILMMIVFFIIIYILGAFGGYEKQIPTLAIIGPIVTIIATEYLRYIIIAGNRDTGIYPYLITLSIIVLQLVEVIRISDFNSLYSTVFILVTIVAPIVLRNLLLTAYAHHIDFKLTVFYAVFITHYDEILPIVPKLGDYAYSFAYILLTFLSLVQIYRLIAKNYEGYTMISWKDGLNFLDVLVFLICASFGIMISQVTPIQMFVATDKPNNVKDLNKGDGPIVLKGANEFMIEANDVILIKEKSGDLKLAGVVRMEEIVPQDKSKPKYREIYILGENGEEKLIKTKDIYGKVLLNIKYVFIPALYIQDYIGGNK